jgi:nucleoside-diphosphate-sugar epimerase
MVDTNIIGTLNVMDASIRAGAEVIVNTGSSSEYGFQDHAPLESDPGQPNSAYGLTKVSATLLCQELARQAQVRTPTLRLYSVYGPLEEPTRLIETLLVRALSGELPPLAHRLTSRDFVLIEDVLDAYIRAAEQPHSDPAAIFNVGTGVWVADSQRIQRDVGWTHRFGLEKGLREFLYWFERNPQLVALHWELQSRSG